MNDLVAVMQEKASEIAQRAWQAISFLVLCALLLHAVGSFAAERPVVYPQLGHQGGVLVVAYSPDGRHVLSGGKDGMLILWDAQTGRLIRSFKVPSGWVEAAAFSGDGRYAVSGSGSGTLILWDLETGRAIRTMDGHTSTIRAVQFSPDGKSLVSGSRDNTLRLWNVETGEEVRRIPVRGEWLVSVGISRDGKHALAESSDNDIHFFELASGREIGTFRTETGLDHAIAFSPDGKHAISGGRGNVLVLRDLESGREVRRFKGHRAWIDGVSFSPDGKYVLSGSQDRTMILWNVATGDNLQTFHGHGRGVQAAAFGPDGQYVLSGSEDGTVCLWKAGQAPADRRPGAGSRMQSSPVRTFRGTTGWVLSFAFSRDGTSAVVGGNATYLNTWDLGRGVKQSTPNDLTGSIKSLAFSPDGRQILSADWENLRLWDVASGKVIRTLTGHTNRVNCVAFSPDGKHVLSGSLDKTLKLWDVSTGRAVRTFQEGSPEIYSIAFSPDGKYVVSAGFLKNLILWDVKTARALRTIRARDLSIYSVAFSPDGKCFASAGRDIRLWDLSGRRVGRIFPREARSISFSPDGGKILAGGSDGTLTLWDVSTGKEIRTLAGHSGRVLTVSFSRDGRRAFSGSSDTTVKIWDMNSGKELATLVNFSQAEWLVITPEGFFNASRKGPEQLNVRMGNRVFGLDQFYDVFYRPDIVDLKLRGEEIADLVSTNLEEALRNPPPLVEFVNIPWESAEARVAVGYRVRDTGGGIGEVRLFHNGKLVQSDGYYRESQRTGEDRSTLLAHSARSIKEELRGVAIAARNEGRETLTESAPKSGLHEGRVLIDAISGINEVGLAAFNRQNTVQSILKTATFRSALKREEPSLHVLAVGIDEFRSPADGLKYAVKDADDFTRKIKEVSATIYRPENIHVTVLKNRDSTKREITNRLRGYADAVRPNDVFVLFIASHGVIRSGLYSIVTHDYDGILTGQALINSREIMEISKNIKALRQIFILDTCHAGGVDAFVGGLYDARMTVLALSMGLHVFASASSAGQALEGYKGKNGMFTHAIIEGLSGNRGADEDRDSRISVQELGSFTKVRMEQYSRETGHTQTPVINNFGKDVFLYVIK